VVAIAELSPREEDSSVMDRAVKDSRILITEDKDSRWSLFFLGGLAGVADRFALRRTTDESK
jgi:predicted nuclease of predicted toxin-antitoxin system